MSKSGMLPNGSPWKYLYVFLCEFDIVLAQHQVHMMHMASQVFFKDQFPSTHLVHDSVPLQ